MTTDAIILARVKTNPTFRTEDNAADSRAVLRVDPLASLGADSESVMGKKPLSESAGPPGQQPAHADPAHLGASLPPPYGCRKTPSAEPQKIPLLPSAGGVVTSDGEPLDWGLNSIASFLKISPYAAATMYPFLDMAYKAALMAPPSPFLYQHLAYPSWCQMSESGSPQDRLFYLPHYVPAHLSSHFEPDLRTYACSPAEALSPRRPLRGHQQASAFGTSLRQDTRCSAFPFNERHLSKSSANSAHSTSTSAGSAGNGSSAGDPVDELVPASASVPLPLSTAAGDSWEISKRSSAQRCGFSPFPVGSRGSEPDPPKPTGSSREKSASPDRRSTEKSPSPARTSVDGKVHQLPLDLSAKKMKTSSDGFQSKSDFIAQFSYGPQTGDARCLKEGLFPPSTLSAKTSEPPKVMNSSDQGAVGSPSSQRPPESFSSTKLGRRAPHVTDSQDARTFSGKQMSPKVRGQDNRANVSEPRQPDVELGSTSGAIRPDSFIPRGLGFSNGYLLPYLSADDASLRRMSISAATFKDLERLSETCHGGQNRSRQKPNRTRKPDPERSGSGSGSGSGGQRASNQPLKSFCKPFSSVSESVVGLGVPFEDVDETGGRRGVRAPASRPHPLRGRSSSPPPAPSKEISTEASRSPSPEVPVQQTMHCARTCPEQFSKKKQIGAPSGCDSSARCERGAEGLGESDDEGQLDRSPSSHIDVRCSTAQFLNGAAVGRGSRSDGPVFTGRTTTTCGDTPSQVNTDDTESCVSSTRREQNSADDGQSISCGCAVGDRLGPAPLPLNNSRAVFRDGEKNSPDIVDVQVGEGKDTRISNPAESFSGSLDSQAKYETEESCVSQSGCPRQEQSKPKENQDDETATSREAEPADGPPCDASGGEGGWLELCQQSEGRGGGGPAPARRVDPQKDAQASSICVTPARHRANDLVGKGGCSPEKEESHREERRQAPPVTAVAGFHCDKPSSVMGLGDLDPDMATNHQRVLDPASYHQSSVGVKRRRMRDNGTENPSDGDVTPEDMSKQKSCNELNGPCIKKPRLPDDDVKVHMASSSPPPPGLPRAPRQMGSRNLWQASSPRVAAPCLREKRQKWKENRGVSSLLPLSSPDDPEKPRGKHLRKTKHTSEAAEEADEERGDGEGGIVRVSSDSGSPPAQPSFAVEPAGETPSQHAARSGHEEALLDRLQRRLCNINHRDNAGCCALHEACARGWLTIVRHLVERGADVNCRAQDGTRPLHDAVENNHVEVVRFLLACGADPTLTSCSGRGPTDVTGRVAMETFLEEYLADLQGRPEGDSGICWDFYGSSVCEPSTEGGVYNILAHPPGPEEDEEEEEETERRLGREEFESELSDQPPLPCYTLQVSPATGPRNWLLLRDVLAHLQMTAHAFRRLFPHLEVFTIPEAEFYCQTSPPPPCAHPAQQASFRSHAKDWLHLVEATPEMSAALGSSLEFVNDREPPVVSDISSPRPAPPPPPPPPSSSSSSPGVPVLPAHATGGGASQGQSQDCAPVTSAERKANASSCVTRSQETINMSEAKNKDSVACEVQHLQKRVAVSTRRGSEENSQCGENTDAHTSNRNSQNEDGEGVPRVVGEAFEKVSARAIEQKCQSLRDLSGQTVKMDAAWRRHLANVRVHVRDLGMKFAGGRTPSNVMDYRKVVDKVTESKATRLQNQPGR